MSAHTPGPWSVRRWSWPTQVTGPMHQIISADNFPTAFVPAWDQPQPGETEAGDEAKANARLIADAPRMHDLLAACEPYLKDGETPAQRIERERRDTAAALELLVREKRKTEVLLHAAKTCLEAERERRKKLLPGAPATTYCEKRIELIEAAIEEAEAPCPATA